MNVKYDFTFTAASLRLQEMILVAKAINNKSEIDYINDLGAGKASTGKRLYSELKKRVSQLTEEEIEILINGSLTAQKQISLIAVCKSHPFIGDFVVEVLREKLLLFDYYVSDGEFLSFYRRKNDMHPEMDSLTENTQQKIKQVTFKILEQADLIDSVKNKVIQPQIIDSYLIKAIINDNPSWLKFLFMSDADIRNSVLSI